MYEDSITQCRKTLEEHHQKYTETPLAQKYYKENEEVEGIRKRVLKYLENYKWKEDVSLDTLGTAIVNAFTIKPFGSALHIEGAIWKTSDFTKLIQLIKYILFIISFLEKKICSK